MRKLVLSAALCMSVGMAFGQMKLVNSALSEAKAEKPNYKEAIANIDQALKNQETEGDVKTWYTAGFIQNKQFESERNKQILNQKPDEKVMYGALLASYTYFVKALQLDQVPNEKGKIKPKYTKEIKEILKSNQSYFINGGAFYFDQKDYKMAYELFNAYNEIPQLDVYKADKAVVDTNANMIKFYTAVAASQIPDHKLAVKNYEDLKGKNYKENEVYQYLVYELQQLKDTAVLISTLKEAAAKFPKDALFNQNLINIYINQNNLKEAISYLDEAIKQDPKSVQLLDVMGRLYETEKNYDKAIECFNKALAIDPDYAETLGNIGRIYFNRAVEISTKASEIKDNKKYNEFKTKEVNPAFQKALPFYEKAHKMKPEEKEYMIALRGIYYNLNMGDKYKAIEEELNK